MERKTLFAKVLLPLALPETYTFRIPFELNNEATIGKRVAVQFGKTRIYSGLIIEINEEIPQAYEVKYILEILDKNPIISNTQLEFWNWISNYYMCTLGEVMNAALPSGLKMSSETKIMLNPFQNINESELNDREFLIFQALELQETLTITEVSSIVELKNVLPLIKTLIEKGVVITDEDLQDKYTPKWESFLQLHPQMQDEDAVQQTLDILEKKAGKQFDLLMGFLSISNFFGGNAHEVSKIALLKKTNSNDASLQSLVKKNILQIVKKEVSRLIDFDQQFHSDEIQLSDEQNACLKTIQTEFSDHQTVLLHGVTGSGKTEIYIKLIQETIEQGKQVLYLVPEISLTTQTINRLRKYFGKKVGIYHSRYNEKERVEIWHKVLNTNSETSSYQIILGARSAVFLPFSNLGLIILDEEHDSSYKQYEPSPRYNARDSALFLANLHHAKCLLGSATPSLESYYNSKSNKFGYCELNTRFGDILLPEIKIVNTEFLDAHKEMKSHFSKRLIEGIQLALDKKEQVILFQNRRGFALRLVCDKCQWMPQCKNCDVTLTLHKQIGKLKCHYCGYTTPPPQRCPACQSAEIKMQGFGTEKVEDELPIFFPQATIKRMDLETTRTKNSYQEIINDFEDRKIDILVGTQMVTKGLDFDNVSLVGVMNADNMLSYPDFRSFERSFQQLTQVSGRAGRKGKQGDVIIQTRQPNHPVIQNVLNYNQEKMFETQLLERQNFKYPPFYKLILISLKHKNPQFLNESASYYAALIRPKLGSRVLGPEFPLIGRIKGLYIKNIMIKFEANASSKVVKEILLNARNEFYAKKELQAVKLIFDVDPM